MSLSPHIDNKKKDILILGKSPTLGLEVKLTAEKMYSIKFVWAYIIKKQIIIYFLMVQKLLHLKLEILKFWQVYYVYKTFQRPITWHKDTYDNTTKTNLNVYTYDFSADYALPVDDILDIHKYLMKKNYVFGFVKQIFVSTMFFSGKVLNVNS